jgi:cytochrome c oxidase cbb3-type subunit IV
MDLINDLRSATTLLSFLIFLGIVWWAYRRGSKEFYDEAANLPFAEDDEVDMNSKPSPR